MFREMNRKGQQLPQDECIGILKKELRGFLSVIGDDGYPYGLPITISTVKRTESSTSTAVWRDTR